MFHRILNHSKSSSFFIFGARGTGKSTYLKQNFPNAHFIDLLQDRWESRYLARPDRLIEDLEALPHRPDWVVIDEVQKVPKLLDLVHRLIEDPGYRFILTGSSARKLKRGQANLLAGRAFSYSLFPLTFLELENAFELDQVLRWGTLPKIYSFAEGDRAEYLRSYAQTYLREEILQEQIVRNGTAFRQFLEVAAQENGKTLNFSRIAREVGVDTKTAQSFFQILEDTLIGFFLPGFHRSTRKSVQQQPKFYLFDLGIKKALEHSLEDGITPGTAAYGHAFEHFVICEAFRLNQYFRRDFSLYHYRTSAGGEIDLVLQRAKKTIVAEIKSTDRIDEAEVRKLDRVSEAVRPTAKFYVSRDTTRTQIGGVACLSWRDFLREVFE